MNKRKSILVVDDEQDIRRTLQRILERKKYKVSTADDGQAALEIIQKQPIDLILTDLKMPRMDGVQLLKAAKRLAPEIEVILITAYGEVGTAVEAMRNGAFHFITKPPNRSQILLTVARALEKRALVLENQAYRDQLAAAHHGERIIGNSTVMQKLIAEVEKIAPSDSTVLILGQTGTGKEVIADAIHAASPRCDKAMVKINCAAIPENLLESDLFGHERGAFTGAKEHKLGRFELASGGTLFLDEIGDMSMDLQSKLLRVIQQGEFERVGSTETIAVDVRLIAATNKALAAAVEADEFREDLFYRLKVMTLELPPLRERREDVPLLANHFMTKYSEKNRKPIRGIAREAVDALKRYGWPGNVRELENVIERAVVLTETGDIELAHLPELIRPGEIPAGPSIVIPVGTPMGEIQQIAIEATLEITNGDKKLAASMLDIAVQTIYRKLKTVNEATEAPEAPPNS
jgi:two-component system response regulator HydG